MRSFNTFTKRPHFGETRSYHGRVSVDSLSSMLVLPADGLKLIPTTLSGLPRRTSSLGSTSAPRGSSPSLCPRLRAYTLHTDHKPKAREGRKRQRTSSWTQY